MNPVWDDLFALTEHLPGCLGQAEARRLWWAIVNIP